MFIGLNKGGRLDFLEACADDCGVSTGVIGTGLTGERVEERDADKL